MRRKPGMSRQDFVAYYEDVHRRMGETAVNGLARRYLRRYLDPVHSAGQEPRFDVLTEMWFESRDDYERGMAQLRTDDFIEDYMRLFEPASSVQYLVDERESAL